MARFTKGIRYDLEYLIVNDPVEPVEVEALVESVVARHVDDPMEPVEVESEAEAVAVRHVDGLTRNTWWLIQEFRDLIVVPTPEMASRILELFEQSYQCEGIESVDFHGPYMYAWLPFYGNPSDDDTILYWNISLYSVLTTFLKSSILRWRWLSLQKIGLERTPSGSICILSV